jgi:ABC-type Na+ efflux pump permease subunit
VRGFGAAFRAEAHDLALSPLAWAGLLATGAATWVFGAITPIRDNGYLVFGAALEAGAKTASFFLMGLAAVSVAGERTRGTVRFVLPRPVSRQAFVLGKAAAVAAAALAFLVLAVAVSWATARGLGFGDVVPAVTGGEGGFEFVEDAPVDPEFAAPRMRARAVAAAALVLPALLTATGIGLVVSSFLRGSAGAVIVAFAVAIPLNFVPDVLGLGREAAHALPFRAASDFLAQLREFGRMLATAEWPAYGAPSVLGALAAVLGLPLLAAAIFSRLDLTD